MGPPADINFGGLNIHLYSLLVSLGIFVGYSIARKNAFKSGIRLQHFDNTILLSLLFGLLGARLFFVMGHWFSYFKDNIGEVLQFWHGGLAFYGALIGGLIAVLISQRIYKFSLWQFLDSLALGLPLAQAVGRIGNYFNQEAYGSPTNLPWGIYINTEKRLPGWEYFETFHPTFLYEALGLVLIYFLLVFFKNKFRLPKGSLFAIYAISSGCLRSLIESLRLDSLMVSGLKVSQLTAIVLGISGVILLLYLYKENGRQTA